MNAKKLNFLLCAFTLFVTSAWAERINRITLDPDDNWTNQNNWVYTSGLAPSGDPKSADVIRIVKGVTVRVTTEIKVGAVHLASEGSGTLIIDGGSLTATLPAEYNSASYKSSGSIIVENGGSATFYGKVIVGLNNAPTGSLIIKQGSVRVLHTLFHNENYAGTDVLNTRTIVYSGGLLDVDALVLNAGTLDLAGGTVVVRQLCEAQINQWIKDGRIIAMSGVDGWRIKVTEDEITGWTTIVAEEEPITLG